MLSIAVMLFAAPAESPARPAVTLTLDALAGAYAELATDLRIDRRFSLALHSGGGARLFGRRAPMAWEIGAEPRWFPGILRDSVYLAWSARFARERSGVIGFESLETPPGFSTGPLLGLESQTPFLIAFDVSVGVLFPLVTPASDATHPPAVFVERLGVGFSF